MKCDNFGVCGGCASFELSYEDGLARKIQTLQDILGFKDFKVFPSPSSGFRSRGEFRIYRDAEGISYAMFALNSNTFVKVSECKILLPSLQDLLARFLIEVNKNALLAHKLFGVEVMAGADGSALLILLYHRHLEQDFVGLSQELGKKLGCSVLARSRGQKIGSGELIDKVQISQGSYSYVKYDNCFAQPNPFVNAKMIEFVLESIEGGRDLLELYCGIGNFTIPLSFAFSKVFATEVSKSAIKALSQNIALNNANNIHFARLSGAESIEALSKKRDFFRLKDLDLDSFDFSHIFVDPPRSGIGDEAMLEFMGGFENIIYVSCNPMSLKNDISSLCKTHTIDKVALFDQFPYTNHIECAITLVKNT